MITKEEKEIIDAISREDGEAMSPFEELILLGFYEGNRAKFVNRNNEIIEMELGGEFSALNEIWEKIEAEADKPIKDWNKVEEYDFDENDEKYRLLADILKLNCDRRKYFA